MADEETLREHLRWVTTNLHQTRQRLQAVEDAEQEPIAIVGMGCRLPGGVRSPQDLWDLVAAGTDAVTGFPENRGWDLDALRDPDPDRPGTSHTASGGFLHDVADFDAGFFGISPREALAMDAQQRLLLETTWEAIERARIDPASLAGSETGVFVGNTGQDYANLMRGAGDAVEGHLLTGTATAVVSGRLAYFLGLTGAAVTVDTACSSSLVALHWACHALRRRECSLALAGGVTVLSTPAAFVAFSRQRGLAADGRCKSFADAADGTGWGEGAGMLVLERLSDAQRNGHPVLAVVRGSAVNQDGASNGLTAPNGPAQERVITEALASARLSAKQVDAVEAHGTGTTLGDPIEAQALLATYGRARSGDDPLFLGSLKSNVGHTQGAAGVAGVIKMVMAMRHGVLPQTLHVDAPTSHVDWTSGGVRLLTEARPWPETGEPRRAGVSAFGMSGTNAHAILEAAPVTEEPEGVETGPVPWVLSARTGDALKAQAAALAAHDHANAADIGFSLVTTRTAFPHRAVVVGDLHAGLTSLAEGTPTANVVTGEAGAPGKVALVFPGQGSQWAGMALELAESSPVFAARLDECATAIESFVDWQLRAVLADAEALTRVDVVQPALFAVMVSLAELWRSFGVVPDAVVGHSQGEIAAAVVSGALSLEDGARVVALRSKAILALAGGGGMVSVAESREAVEERLIEGVSVAAVNGPAAVVVSGAPAALDEFMTACRADDIRVKRVPVDYASHSPQVEQLHEELRQVLAPITPREGEIAFISTVTGEWNERVDADYWYTNLRSTVRLDTAIERLKSEGFGTFIEASPHPVLTMALGEDVTALGSLRRDDGGLTRFHTALAEAYVHGVAVDWTPAFVGARTTDLPTYAFQRERFWPDVIADAGDAGALGLSATGHPLLGAAVALAAGDGLVLTGRVSPQAQPWLADHAVHGTILLPGTAFVELAVQAGDRAGCGTVEELTLETPLTLGARDTRALQVWVGAADETGRRAVEVHSRRDEDDPWIRHATGVLAPGTPEAGFTLDSWPPEGAARIDLDGFYDGLRAAAGYDYGPTFQGLRAAWRRGDEIFAEVDTPDTARFGLHPALLDTALHPLALMSTGDGQARLPFAWTRFALHATGASALRVRLTRLGTDEIAVEVADPAGAPVASAESLAFRPLPAGGLDRSADDLYVVGWTETTETGGTDAVFEPLTGAPVHRVLGLVQDWLATERAEVLVFVTSGAVAVHDGEAPDPDLAAAWGLVRSAQSEHPGRFALLDTDDPDRPVVPPEPQSAVRDGRVFVPRLARATATGETPDWGDGDVLVTGASGMLGGFMARHLAREHGVRRLVLLSRRGAEAPGAAELAADLAAAGTEAVFAACDAADRDRLAEVLAAHRVSAVVHAAGVLDDGVVEALTPERLDAVLRPKADAARNLDELTGDLAAFVLFSAAAGTTGGSGQGNYAAANAYLDALAQRRRAAGKPAVSLAWGLWAEASGMTGHLDDRARDRLGRSGVRPLETAHGLALFDRAVVAGPAALVPIALDAAALRRQAADGAVSPLFRGLFPPVRRTAAAGGHALAEITEEALVELVRTQVAAVLGHASAQAVDPGRAFKDLGFDSLTAVDLRNRLAAATGLRLPATLVFDHPTPAVLAAHLAGRTDRTAVTRPAEADEPIAIVAMSCRYPGGVASPDDLWQLVAEGRDAVSVFPADRGWPGDLFDDDPAHGGTSYAREGGFLYDAAEFDAEFFGMSPREATATDPQQRVLLEIAWEAFERAGIVPESVRGSRTGVFAGVMYQDYATRLQNVRSGLEDYEGYLGNGSAGSVASGRIAYAFGLEGPAITVDTACSSSLVALHLACQSLRQGECDLALAGGVAVLSTPALFVEFSRQRGLAADGRCKSFADAADGTGWGEGAGLLLVERLSDARRNGHPVLAVVRGSAVNQDGASNGLTAPNGPAQQRVIRQALANAGLTTSEVDAVEAHGTGTTLGDPIEAQALLETYGQDRPTPLWLGSLKSNIGHTQAAAGVGGVIKMVMAMRHGVLPRTLHVDAPSSHVDWTAGSVELLTESREWTSDRPLRAAVSSFGVSGTNAHAILEHVSEPVAEPVAEGPVPWVLSGRTPDALRAQAAALLGRGDLPAASVGAALVSTRSLFRHRAVVVGDLTDGLTALAAGAPAANVVTGEAGTPGKVALVFPGQGAQWAGMALELAESSPVFAARLDECGLALESFVDWSLREVLDDAEALSRVDVVQPALFAVMISLAELWRSFGVVPDAVVGHSQGEIAAAVVSGALSLEDGARVVALRSRAILALAGGGGMVSVAESREAVEERLIEGVSVAAVNGPAAVVVSGTPDALDEFMAACRADDIRVKRVPVDYASHSPQVERLRDELLDVLAPIVPRQGDIAFISTVTGEWNETVDAEYWYTNLRSTVRLDTAIERLKSEGFGTFVEASPHPVLTMALGEDVTALGSLRRDDGGLTRFHTALAEAHVNGVRVDWTPAFPDVVPADLPTYAFQRERYWLDVPEAELVHADPADQRFWEVVGDQDVPAFAGVLDLAEDAPLGAVLPALAKWRNRRHDESTTDSWRYRITWRPVTTSPGRLTGRWRVVGDGDDVREILAAHGAELVEDDENLTGVVAVRPDTATALELTSVDAPLWLLTEGAVAAGPDEVPDPAQAQVWGLGRIAGLEHPARWGGLVDLPPSLDETTGARLAAVLTGTTGEDQVALRASGVFARRLIHAGTGEPARRWRPEGTVLVTDADGHAAVRLARWLITRGATKIVLAAAALPGVETLRDAEVVEAYCDVADRDQLAAVLEAHGPVRSVFHAAAVTDLAPLAETGPELLERACRVKASAADHLDALLPDDLDAFVLFSSIAAVVGSGAHGAYAAANAHLDALAERRRARGATATSIAWGVWDADEGFDRDRLVAEGVPPLDPELALTALGRALDHDDTTVVLADVDWARFAPAFAAARSRPLLAEIPEAAEEIPVQTTGFAAQLAGLSAAEAHRVLTDLVRAQAAAVLGHASPAGVDVERAFSELGFDSLTAVELRGRLATATGLRLPATLVFDHPTVTVLAGYLGELLGSRETTAETTARIATDEPIAIVGIGCRFPGGVGSPEDLWRLVAAGGDGITPFPDDRGWDLEEIYDPEPGASGKSYAREGGFLADTTRFDPGFFGISPREALAMDPQQRLLLQTSWEAFERAGLDPLSVRGERIGVFAGTNGQDYPALLERSTEQLEGHAGVGNAASVVSGRLSYVFGLEGPSLTVDTACSSSLVALHLAVQALRRGECSMALAGGATVMATPGMFVDFSLQRGLAADGRSKAFAEAADGAGFSEGAGMLLVQRLSDALREGRRVLAVVRGSAVNSDGASNGLTAPNGPSQQRVIRAALADAGLAPSEVDAVEAHGTGTTLGDPIEAQALLATYGQDRDEPLWLGSVKSNLGHTQAAAGVAGIIKMVMAMRHGVLPQTLHVDAPSSHVDWSSGAVELLTESRDWTSERPRRAGVSSFGISGTNAHTILEQAPDVVAEEREPVSGPVPWVLAGRTEAALRDQAAALATVDGDPADIGFTLATARSRFPYRAVVLGADALTAVAEGTPAANAVTGIAGTPGKVALVFPGQGSQWPGMALELAESSPVFAARLDACGAALNSFVDWDLRAVLIDADALNRVDVVQPALWAVMVSLAELWRSFGVIPDAVVGHSQGEIAAAVVSGALSLEDGARVVTLRSRAILALAGRGGMVSVAASLATVEQRLTDGLSIAAVNGPAAVVVSGTPQALDELIESCEADGIRAKRVPVDYASHSAQVEQLRDELREVLAPITPREAEIAFISTVTGEWNERVDAEYWYTNLRSTVRLDTAVERLKSEGFGTFIEASPHPVLTMALGDDVLALGSLRRDDGGLTRFHTALAEAHVNGVRVDWTPAFPGARLTDLPTYPFQQDRYWPQWTATTAGDAGGLGLTDAGHPLLGAAVTVAGTGATLLTGRLSLSTHPWLADHAVGDTVLLPGTAFVELAVRAGDQVGCATVEELTLQAPLVLPRRGGVAVQARVEAADEDGRRTVTVHSRPNDDADWTQHAEGILAVGAEPGTSLTAWPPAGAEPLPVEGHYDTLAGHGYRYGPAFQGLRAAWRHGDDLYAEVVLPDDQRAEAARYGLHPALLDAALHPIGLTSAQAGARLPFAWTGVRLYATGATTLRVRLGALGADGVSVAVADESGAPVAEADSLVMRPISAGQLAAAADHGTDSLFTLDWQRLDTEPATAAVPLGEPGPVAYAEFSGDAIVEALGTVQEFLAGEHDGKLVLVTESAVGEAPADPEAAAVWGLVRSAQSEHPGRFVLLDVDTTENLATWAGAAAASGEPQLALRGGEFRVPRLARATPPKQEHTWNPDGTVLVTGASGVLGGLLARHLVTVRGVRHLLLLSRSAPAVTDELAGASVTVLSCDVADKAALESALATIPAEHPLTAVVHAAGALDDGVLEALTPERLDTVLRPKALAAKHLHELTAHLDLDAFVLFSSFATTMGGAGQAGYSAANAYLDALAQHRRGRGLPATSLAWGLWEARSGLTAHLGDDDVSRLGRSGVRALPTDRALRLFDLAVSTGEPLLMPVALDLAAWRARPEVPALLRGLVRTSSRRAVRDGVPAGPGLAERLAGLPEAEQPRVVDDVVRAQVAAVLGYASGNAVEAGRGFLDLGFDSLTALELRNRLNAVTGLRLPATLIFDYPNPDALTKHLCAELPAGGAKAALPVHAELDRLAAVLAATEPGAGERDLITERLRGLLARWTATDDRRDEPGTELADATAEEIFDLLDDELGMS
ncbi:acyl transferase domain-containing protein [Amycolatopsis lexingtonensis]|uniref:Acyl transferase domain-containing protein n=1 Tax=Amycolatopsis lexingtonensis TaxID=218822 RepID=A0ABR9IGB7_9PSEU|nr:type I polyketide synthase [Amycolatopsis lexingtonensis]MBE1502214.1 acyl transferase domain-containing protein [Amycolatopsis lexingtonensis]